MSVATSTIPTDAVNAEWAEVPSEPGYRISTNGQIQTRWKLTPRRRGLGSVFAISDRWKTLKPQSLPSGYRYIHIYYTSEDGKRKKRIRYIHALILEAFIGPCPHGQEVRHLNGTNYDNRLDNLAYGTKFDNAADMKRHGTRPIGSRHGIAKLIEAEVVEIKAMLLAKISMRIIGDRFGVSRAAIEKIHHGETWLHVNQPPVIPSQPLPA